MFIIFFILAIFCDESYYINDKVKVIQQENKTNNIINIFFLPQGTSVRTIMGHIFFNKIKMIFEKLPEYYIQHLNNKIKIITDKKNNIIRIEVHDGINLINIVRNKKTFLLSKKIIDANNTEEIPLSLQNININTPENLITIFNSIRQILPNEKDLLLISNVVLTKIKDYDIFLKIKFNLSKKLYELDIDPETNEIFYNNYKIQNIFDNYIINFINIDTSKITYDNKIYLKYKSNIYSPFFGIVIYADGSKVIIQKDTRDKIIILENINLKPEIIVGTRVLKNTILGTAINYVFYENFNT